MSSDPSPPTAPDAGDLRVSRLAVNAVWLLRLRWVAVAGQLLTVGYAAAVFDVRLRMGPLLAVIAVTAATNVAATIVWRRLVGRSEVAVLAWAETLFLAVMVFDVFALTALLYFAGGPANPFTVFYFVNLSLAAVILPARLAGWLVAIAIVGYLGLLAVASVPLPELGEPKPLAGIWPWHHVKLQHQGLFVALAGCASVVVYFITCVTRELGQREAELRAAEAQRARSQRLEALATLAAGAAHELATPLGTIAVVAKELTRHLEGTDVPKSVQEDVALIRGELDHCRGVLDRLSTGAGQAVGEEVKPVPASDLAEEILSGLRRRARVEVSLPRGAALWRANVPLQTVSLALRGVVQNALDATDPDGPVAFSVTAQDSWLQFTVRDTGPGMSADVLARAGDPFFTTKEPGQGMGLGLFLCRSVVERLGGTFELQSKTGQGVTAVIRLPRHRDEEPTH